MGAIGRAALRRNADTAAVVVRQVECGFRFMILTFSTGGSGLQGGSGENYPSRMLPATGCVRLK
jgi:hypothetical protein